MLRKKYTPEAGKTYLNQAGGSFLCLRSGGTLGEGEAELQNTESSWTFIAHGCCIYEDGTIDWACSTNGHFADTRKSESIDLSECKPASPTNTPLFRAYTAMYDTGWQTYHLALTLNEAETNAKLQSFVDWWTRGDSFIPRLFGPVDLDAPPKREADTDEELSACLERLHGALQTIICESWAVGMSRRVCLLLCNSMLLPTGLGADFRLLPDLTLTAHDIAGLWSKTHPDEQEISYNPDFAI